MEMWGLVPKYFVLETSLMYLVWPSASSLLILQCFQCFPLRSFRYTCIGAVTGLVWTSPTSAWTISGSARACVYFASGSCIEEAMKLCRVLAKPAPGRWRGPGWCPRVRRRWGVVGEQVVVVSDEGGRLWAG